MRESMDSIYVTMEYYNHRVCTPQWSIVPDRLHFIDITYVVKGSAAYNVDGKMYTVKQGDILCIPQGSNRWARSDPDCLMECYSMNFQLYDFYTHKDVKLPFELITHIGTRPHLIHLMDDLYRTWLLHEEGYQLRTNAYALLIISELLSINRNDYQLSNADLRVRKVVDYIMQHYGEPLSIAMLAEMVHLNPVYLSSLFRKSLGSSVKQYIKRIRVNSAQFLLEEGIYNITEVATLCGFCDIYYFSRIFKQLKGVSPSTIIKK
ncbi:MAG: AraC family transcriptional regulator [Oscillospiraceae bacterium]|jgi:AraC-like DNA-binding protein|nr:AraC family transcriptional regulator [Oscillospiraceae bacterium]